MKNIYEMCERLWRKLWRPATEEGQGLVEYALILFLVVMVVIVMLIILGPQVGSLYSAITTGIS